MSSHQDNSENQSFADSFSLNSDSSEAQQQLLEIPVQYQRKCTKLFGQIILNENSQQLDLINIQQFYIHNIVQPNIQKSDKSRKEIKLFVDKIVKRISLGRKIRKRKPLIYLMEKKKRILLMKSIQLLQEQKFSAEVIAAFLKIPKAKVSYYIKEVGCSETHYFPFSFQKEHQIWLIQKVKSLDSFYLTNIDYIYSEFIKTFNLTIQDLSKSVMTKFLKRIGLTYKQLPLKPLQALKKNQDTQILDYCLIWASLKEQGYSLLYIDESAFSHAKNKIKSWQITNTNDKNRQFVSINEKLNILGCIGDKGFQRYQIVIGTGNQYIFAQYLNQVIIAAKDHFKENKFCVILDNCQIHKAKLVAQIITKNINIVFLPPYSPQFNPIENIWSMMKQYVVKSQPRTNSALIHSINEAVTKMKPYCLQRTLNHQYRVVQEILLKYIN